jgi:hypothetical protein
MMSNLFKAVLSLGIVAGIAFGVALLIRRDDSPTRINATFNQLRKVHAEIQQAFFDLHSSNTPISEVRLAILKDHGADYLLSDVDQGKTLMINPSLDYWTGSGGSNQLALVSPVRFLGSENGGSYYIGITFSGERTNVSSLPNWLGQ